jgi:DNA-binding winged helix-turn-helix (wHTH) protein
MAHGDRSVDVFVRKLRSKLQQASPDWHYIHTHFGVGYRFAAERAGAVAVAVAVAGAPVAPAPVAGAEAPVAPAAGPGATAPQAKAGVRILA